MSKSCIDCYMWPYGVHTKTCSECHDLSNWKPNLPDNVTDINVGSKNPYWDNVCRMADKQRKKGVSKYGFGLEDNPLSEVERIEYLQEELIDGLMYCEHIKANVCKRGLTANEYQKAAMRTAGAETETDLLINGVMGLSGEAGECVDLVKKHVFQGHELDKEHLAKELGDVAWYLAITAKAIDYPLETVMQMNIDKLKKRYPDGFDVEKSVKRSSEDL